MLARFTVENYRSFNEPITIDFENVHDYKYNKDALTNDDLGKILIYGKNGSGKSNLGLALFDIVGVLTDKNNIPLRKNGDSYINVDSEKKFAKFSYTFKDNGDRIIYEYEKKSFDEIVKEKFIINDIEVFVYDFENKEGHFDHLELVNAESLNFDYFNFNLPILRYIAYNTSQNEGSYVRSLMDFVSHMLWFRSLRDTGYIGYTTGSETISKWIIDNNKVKEFNQFLKEMGDIDVELGVTDRDIPIKNINQVIVEQHKNGSLYFDNIASSGTATLELFFYWGAFFNDVSLLFIDEFDAYYHQELAKNVIKYVKSFPNIQAIFTTHNSSLASNDIMRPDCCFMLENGRLRSFADSTDRELREGHNIEKMLRAGEFNERS